MRKPTVIVFLVLVLLAAGCKKEGDDARSTGVQPDKQGEGGTEPAEKDRNTELGGDWQADFDDSELHMKRAGDVYSGNYTKLSTEVQGSGFKVGELVMRGFKSSDGKTYKGELKWHSGKREEWKPAVITLDGDHFKIEPGSPGLWVRLPVRAAP